MDYTPISARRVLMGFSFTAFLAFFPLLFLYLSSNPSPFGFLSDADGSYRGLVLGAGSGLLTMVLVGLVALTFVMARRVVRRPVRA